MIFEPITSTSIVTRLAIGPPGTPATCNAYLCRVVCDHIARPRGIETGTGRAR